MDWTFYLVVGGILFVFVAAVMIGRYFLMLRLEKLERRAAQQEEARDIAEANSGL